MQHDSTCLRNTHQSVLLITQKEYTLISLATWVWPRTGNLPKSNGEKLGVVGHVKLLN